MHVTFHKGTQSRVERPRRVVGAGVVREYLCDHWQTGHAAAGVTAGWPVLPGAARLAPRHGIAHQKAPQAHAQEEAQEDAEGHALAATGGPLAESRESAAGPPRAGLAPGG